MELGVVAPDAPETNRLRYGLAVTLETLGFFFRFVPEPKNHGAFILLGSELEPARRHLERGGAALWFRQQRQEQSIERIGRGFLLAAPVKPILEIAHILSEATSEDPDLGVLDMMAACRRAVLRLCAAAGQELVVKREWPDGYSWALALSHDVDWLRRWRLRSVVKGVFTRRAGEAISCLLGLRADPWWNFDRIMDLEEERALRSTFFFLADNSRYRLPARTIKKLLDGGWEVELHANSFPHEKRLIREKRLLERRTGQTVRGNRYHHLRFKTPLAGQQLGRAGFEYDSSVGFATQFGLRTGLCFPYRTFCSTENAGLPLYELPFAVMDTALGTMPDRKRREIDVLARQVRTAHGCLGLLWHHRSFDDQDFPGWGDVYRSLLDKNRDAWRAPCGRIVDWWRARSRVEIAVRGKNRLEVANLPAGNSVRVRYFGPKKEVRAPGGCAHRTARYRDGFEFDLGPTADGNADLSFS